MLIHGMSRRKNRPPTPTYQSWRAMKTRCTTKTSSQYHRYGGAGISICSEWLTFENFLADMGERPPGTSIDRIDNTKGYFKENCRWATAKTQARNRKLKIGDRQVYGPFQLKEKRSERGPQQRNRSGVVGVYWNAETNSWRVSKKIDGRNIYLGLYPTIEEAKAAYDAYHR